jgi:uncharacterized damage-inducible protein DinB
MDLNRLFLIGDLPGFTPQIGRLVSMMNYVRVTTLDEVEGMSVEQLDYLHDAGSNSIGALLLHAAAVEFEYRANTLHGRELSADEMRIWEPALELGEKGRREIRGHDSGYYIERLQSVREMTLEDLRHRDDDWLMMEFPFWGGHPANNYFVWFHVIEDELNHRGQIRWLKKRAGKVRGT